ncbi:hypothetical protein [Bacillus sp. FSL L8-0152]|uniref:hypothetical protein n=1 Tax=Bacillus sp. FSL L8-0152 TaxID=2921516 RepID=UPI0030F69878
MSQSLDKEIRTDGTRFLIFPQNRNLAGFEQPEIVYLASHPGEIQAGPEDNRFYVVDAPRKIPYGLDYVPPYQRKEDDPVPVPPGPDGHFDYLMPDEPGFFAAMLYASARRVMEIWENYFGRRISWSFRSRYQKLELIPRLNLQDNAYSGDGYIEFGYKLLEGGRNGKHYYSSNFDVIAHEIGHQIKNEIIGEVQQSSNLQFKAHHESFGDLVAIVSVLHFDSVVEKVLESSKGNLFSVNEISRVAELSHSDQIRIAFNDIKFDPMLAGDNAHLFSLPFTGGAFDILVDMYQNLLIEREVIPATLGQDAFHAPPEKVPVIQAEFEQLYLTQKTLFKEALLNARDMFGRLMATAWDKTTPQAFSFRTVVNHMIDADYELYQGKYSTSIRQCFFWRKLEEAPPLRLPKPKTIIHHIDI